MLKDCDDFRGCIAFYGADIHFLLKWLVNNFIFVDIADPGFPEALFIAITLSIVLVCGISVSGLRSVVQFS